VTLLKKRAMRTFHSSAFGALLLIATALPALAQNLSVPPGGAGRNPACARLETQLGAIDRGGGDPAKSDQVRRYEEASAKQQAELDKLLNQSRRAGCQGAGFFSIFSGQPPQCVQINNQIQQMRSNLDQITGTLQQLQSNTAGREGQRRSVIVALAQNDCGPQYRQAAAAPQQGGGFFDTLFGPGNIMTPDQPADPSQAGGYKTVCVRTCDGFYFPISYSASPERFSADQQTCQRMCPSAEVQLFTYRNGSEEISQAVSVNGYAYKDLPTAFSYRKEVNKACSCKRPGQTWNDAMKSTTDDTVEQGDIVVTDERARQMSQPTVDAQGKRIAPRPAARPAQTTAPATTSSTPPATGEKKTVRTVGPTFVPAQ
jgi:hypothetical protein